MKRIMVLFVTIGFFGVVFLPTISSSNLLYEQSNTLLIRYEEAQKVTETKISLSKYSDYFISETIEIKNIDDSPLMYVFSLNPQGYIVVPANKKLPPVITYSFENEFGAISEKNVLLQILKADILSRIEHVDLISENIIKNRNEQWQKYTNQVKINQQNIVSTVGPLLDTQWSQNAPYNNFCPIDKASGQREIGYIAEEFHGMGLKNLVIYDKDGRPDGLKYELVSLYLLEIMKDQVEALRELKDLKNRIEALESR